MKIRLSVLQILCVLCAVPCMAEANGRFAKEDPGPPDFYTVDSPEWLRLSSVVSAIHPHPADHVLPTYLVEAFPSFDADRRSFHFIMPSQGLPGIVYQPAMWAEFKTTPKRSVTTIDYPAMERAARTVHRKGNWLIPHAPASIWWPGVSGHEPPEAGAVYMNMMLLANDPPPDGFNFDAILDQGADLDGIRRMAEKLLPGGRYVMLGEYGDWPAYNSHLSYLYGPKFRPWDQGQHGQLYIGYGVRGLDHNVVWEHGIDVSHPEDQIKPSVPQDVRLRLGLWDAMFWGGVTPWFQPFPGGPIPADEVVELMKLVQLFQFHADLQGLVYKPRKLPPEQVLVPDLGVNHFNGAEPAYFRTEDSPGADKQIHTFKTGDYYLDLGDPDYYVALPPTLEKGPAGDILSVPHEKGFHWISAGIDGTRRMPARREGDRVILAAPEGIAVYGQTPRPGETVYMIRYREILHVQRAGPARLRVQVGKTYTEPLSVELELRREGEDPRTRVVTRPVTDGQVLFDLQHLFGMDDLNTDDAATIRLYREHELSDWHVLPLLCDEVVLDRPEHWEALSSVDMPEISPPPASPRRIASNEALVSTTDHVHSTLEFRARFPEAGAKASWIGFMEESPAEWDIERYAPDAPRHLMAFRYVREEGESRLEAVFDNGSGLVERSGGMRITLGPPESPRRFNANELWGDYLWPYANERIEAFDPKEWHIYRIEWQRLWQRWYIDHQLVYERRLVQNEPLPLLIHNAGDGDMEIEWLRINPL